MNPQTQKPPAARKLRKVSEFLASQSTLVLSTRSEDGSIHATPLFYLPQDNLDLIWLSSPRSLHSRSLRIEPRASLAIFHSTFEWRKIAGVQMHGVCSLVEGAERSLMVDAYCARFELGAVPTLAISRSCVYRFRPQWIRYIDNRKCFGYSFELTL